MQYDSVADFIGAQLPPRARGVIAELKDIMRITVMRYVSAYVKLMAITFAELSIGLLVLRAPNAVLIAAGIAVFDALPLFGTGAIVIPWVITELVKGNFPFAAGLLILYALVTVIRNIIEPKIVGDKLGLNPIVSLVSIYLGFRLLGVFGMILMPILTQILLELHKRGKIRLFRFAVPAGDNSGGVNAESAKQ
jgi:sporulation integral membrane protein YtvI